MPLTAAQKNAVLQCKKSCIFFLGNFCKIKHPSAGILPFKPFKYQRFALQSFRTHRFTIFKKCRQSGLSQISGMFALWFAMFHPHKTILIVSRTDVDARAFLKRNIVFTFDHLPKWMREAFKPTKNNEHEFELPNGSKIRSLTSAPDVLRSNASSLNIIDEAAFIPQMDQMWAAGSPSLMHGGCLSGNTLVLGDGLRTLESYHDGSGGWCDSSGLVATDGSVGEITAAYDNGVSEVLTITTEDGHSVTATPNHKFRALIGGQYVWRKSSELREGDQLVLSLARDVVDPEVIRLDDDYALDEELAEFLGLLWGDGFYQERGVFGISLCPDDLDIEDYARSRMIQFGAASTWIEESENDRQIRCCCKNLASTLLRGGLRKGKCPNITIPDVICKSSIDVRAAFLRGLFEADGSITDGDVTLSSASLQLQQRVQTILLSFGIRSKISEVQPSEGRFSNEMSYSLRLKTRRDVIAFRASIGFLSARKQELLDSVKCGRIHNDRFRDIAAIEEVYDFVKAAKLGKARYQQIWRCRKNNSLPRHTASSLLSDCPQFATTVIGKLTNDELFTDSVATITKSTCRTWDLTESSKHTYIANGFVTHNSAIIISTVQGIGNWYWNTWMDASIGKNNFNPIEINWWDMDWKIEYPDALTGKMFKIEPTDGLRECTTVDEINKYGPYWSPWLEDQWRDLQSRGESWKFKQEILAVFAGSGNTVVPAEILKDIGDKTSDDFKIVKGPHIYTPVTGEPTTVNFNGGDRELATDEGLWVWKQPVLGKRPVYKNGVIVEPGEPAHNYAAGVDYATGKGADYQAMEVFDLDTMEQVAEIMIHCQPLVFKYIVDYIGRWYNNATLVVERNNGGDGFIDDLRYQLMYPNLWRKRDINDKPSQKSGSRVQLAEYGFMTTGASKNRLNKALLDFLQVGDGGMRIYSTRLHRQLQIYVRKRDRAGNETGKTEAETGPGNHDDLVMASALGFVGLPDCMNSGGEGLIPVTNAGMEPSFSDNLSVLQQMSITRKDPGLMVPFMGFTDGDTQQSVEMALAKFTSQIGALPLASELPLVSTKKHSFK